MYCIYIIHVYFTHILPIHTIIVVLECPEEMKTGTVVPE